MVELVAVRARLLARQLAQCVEVVVGALEATRARTVAAGGRGRAPRTEPRPRCCRASRAPKRTAASRGSGIAAGAGAPGGELAADLGLHEREVPRRDREERAPEGHVARYLSTHSSRWPAPAGSSRSLASVGSDAHRGFLVAASRAGDHGMGRGSASVLEGEARGERKAAGAGIVRDRDAPGRNACRRPWTRR